MVEDEEIKRIVTAHSDDIQGAVDVLIDRANENGGRDNIAIVIVKL